jgi:DNA mismatch repair protein MutH
LNTENAFSEISKISGKTFKELGLTDDQINKGGTGQNLMLKIGLTLTSDLLDTTDGEIKSTMFVNNKPKETVAVSQLQHLLEEIVNKIDWNKSSLYEKLYRTIYVPVHKDSKDPLDWYYGEPVLIEHAESSKLSDGLKEDYEFISSEIRKIIKNKEKIHTISGPNSFLQIRTKASKSVTTGKYTPMIYKGHQLSDKYYAFYLRKEFLHKIFVN